jgi:phosphomannomutase/phosphoglucomutase
VSDARMREMFAVIDGMLRAEPTVGAYNQTI